MKRILQILFLAINSSLFAQNVITGVVLDEKEHKPANYASVYINGSTKGAYTDVNGNFVMEGISFPCRLVISHIGFYPKTITIEKYQPEKQIIYLNEKNRQLSDISVTGNDKRRKNIEEFKKIFFGDVHVEKDVVMMNDSVLYFSRDVDTLRRKATTSDFEKQRQYHKLEKGSYWSVDSAYILTNSEVFTVKSKDPLNIELPLLGYRVYLDLESFKVKNYKGLTVCDYQGFTRFTPYETKSVLKKSKFNKNRQRAYYNSSRHFCKSLFYNKLLENGYVISYRTINDSTKKATYNYVDLRSNIKVRNGNEIEITGLKDNSMGIYYFCDYKGCPIDLSKYGAISEWTNDVWKICEWNNNSTISFLSDSCIISLDGGIRDNNILFGGKIASKRGGALLPIDYLPSNAKD